MRGADGPMQPKGSCSCPRFEFVGRTSCEPGLRGSRILQGARPSAEPRVELHRSVACVADCALDLFEISYREVVPLLQVDPASGILSSCGGRDRVELIAEAGRKVGKFALTSADLLQFLDQRGAFPVGLFEQPAKNKSKAGAPICGQQFWRTAAIAFSPSSVVTRRGARR